MITTTQFEAPIFQRSKLSLCTRTQKENGGLQKSDLNKKVHIPDAGYHIRAEGKHPFNFSQCRWSKYGGTVRGDHSLTGT